MFWESSCRTVAVKFPLSSKSNGSTRLFSSPMTPDLSSQSSIFFFLFATDLLLHFHLMEKYAVCQATQQKPALLCSDLDPNDLCWYRTAGVEHAQNYFHLSTIFSCIAANSCIEAVMASYQFLVNGEQKNPTTLGLKTHCPALCRFKCPTTPFLPRQNCWKALLLISAFLLNASGIRQ